MNWREIAFKHYSTWAFYIISALVIVPEVLNYVFRIVLDPIVIGWLLIASVIFGLIGKFIVQTDKHKWLRRFAISVMIIFAAAFSFKAHADHSPFVSPPASTSTYQDSFDDVAFNLIARWEGKKNHAYQDIVGVWTICFGHTLTAVRGMYKSDAECKAMLIDEIAEYREGLHGHFNNTTLWYRLTPHRDAAYTSLTYNVGVRAAGRSTAVRRLNKGNIKGGCTALTWWNKAGGRVVRGLVRRRNAEYGYCMRGV